MAKTIPLTEFDLWKNAKKHRTLFQMTLELTKRCNNNCIHCYNNLSKDDPDAQKRELTTSEIKNIVDQGVDLGLLWVTLTGGEVLLREDFFDLYIYMKKKGLLVSVFTNATLITKDHADIFKKYPPRDIEISVYGCTQKGYTAITRKNNYSRFISGIQALKNAGVPFSMKTIAMKANQKHLTQITQFCEKNSTNHNKNFRFDPFLFLRTDKSSKRNKDILNQRLSADEIVTIERQNPDRQKAVKKQCDYINTHTPSETSVQKIFKCSAGINACNIDAYGLFKLCGLLVRDDCVYDLRKGTLKEAWNIFVPKIRSMTSDKKEYQKTCSTCKLIDLCMWCPAIADLETGCLDKKNDVFCNIARRRYDSCFSKN